MLLAVFEYTNRVLNMARPRKVLMIAVDGVAPRAKMNQQRARRFRSAKDAQIENENRERIMQEREQLGEIIDGAVKTKKTWDSNAITPGTPFMDKLAAALRYWCSFKLATDPGWKNLQVIISDATVPGEGEHKIMNFVRSQRADAQYNPNTTHCIYGLDADLIFLGLATHEPHFKVLREDVFAQGNNKRHNLKDSLNMSEEEKQMIAKQDSEKPFLWLHISVLREYLSAELWVPRMPFPFDLERAIDDWVFMCFFCGNDFLPHLPCLDVRENSIDILLDIWKVVLPTMKTYITCDGELNLESVEKLLSQLGSREADIFKTRHIQEVRKQENFERKKAQRNVSKGQDRHPTKPNEQLQLYDTNGNLSKSSWNLTTHDMVNLKKEIMLANEGDANAIATVKAQSDKNDQLMNELMNEQMDKAVDEANKTNFTAAEVMKKKLVAKKRRLEAEEEEQRQEEQKEESRKKKKTEEEATKEEPNLDDQIKAELEEERIEEEEEEEEGQDQEEEQGEKPPDWVPEVSNGGITSGIVDTDQAVKLHEPGYHERYYTEKFHISPNHIDALRKDLVKCYIEGVSWVLLYYYQGCASWTWYYPYHYAPLATDFFGFSDIKVEFPPGKPFLPYEQLMSVLPAASGHTLPPIFRPLMSSPDSEIIDFYPTEFPVDMNGKKMPWQGIALLPFIDEKRLLQVVRAQYSKLTEEEKSRNVVRNPILLISNKNANYEKFLKKLYPTDVPPQPELYFQHFRSGLSGVVSTDHEGYRPNSKLSCPIQTGSLPELSTNLFLKLDYKLVPLPSKNKSIILNGFIASEPVLSPYDLDAVMYKYNNGPPRRWNFENDMRNNVVPVGPCGVTQYKPRVGGYRSFFFFSNMQQQPPTPMQYQMSGPPINNRYNGGGNGGGSRYSGSSRYGDPPNNYRNQNNAPGMSRYQTGRFPQRSGTMRRH
ncbi:hypothetical protein ZYGR_0H05040 [Zygosaccharomyces rouxii]|uniref:5'-3' exoribonuclease n=1 Tax=Zygosaccharomyces rouxii TaxID=4956 RepID=A0A1Q2ZWF9_ZYGRO|nr:hypothetical protein ZYGR_0H05040 [Zygosaccharomyces rouxii]